MRLSDISVQRPVLASVLAALIVAFGLLALERLPLQEYPAIDPPIVSVDTRYPGASSSVVETRITQVLEDRISGIEGIQTISSSSQDGESEITVEFGLDQDIDAAANDMRDRVSGARGNLPDEAEPPEIQKADSSSEVVVWLSLSGEGYSMTELTDYANRYLVDRLSVQPGVSQVRVGGGRDYAMRIWLDRNALAARNLSVGDVEDALREENVELPGGAITSEIVSSWSACPEASPPPTTSRDWCWMKAPMAIWCGLAMLPGSRSAPSRSAPSFAATACRWSVLA